MVLKIKGLKEEEATGGYRKVHMRRFIICTIHYILLGYSNEG
jgi:hypothetical protein